MLQPQPWPLKGRFILKAGCWPGNSTSHCMACHAEGRPRPAAPADQAHWRLLIRPLPGAKRRLPHTGSSRARVVRNAAFLSPALHCILQQPGRRGGAQRADSARAACAAREHCLEISMDPAPQRAWMPAAQSSRYKLRSLRVTMGHQATRLLVKGCTTTWATGLGCRT